VSNYLKLINLIIIIIIIIIIPSEQVTFCLDKPIPEAVQLLEAPPVVCLCICVSCCVALLLIVPTSSNYLSLRVFLRQETIKTPMLQCVGSFVADVPVDCGVWPSARMCCDLPCKLTAISSCVRRTATRSRLAANKLNIGSHFGLVR
jgi:hypothetical protein